MMQWNPTQLFALAIGLVALALACIGLAMAWRIAKQEKNQRVVEHALYAREGGGASDAAERRGWAAIVAAAAGLGARWIAGRFGALLLEEEDRKLIEVGGFGRTSLARGLFVFARVILAVFLPLVFLLWLPVRVSENTLLNHVVVLFLGFGGGWILPKMYVRRRARHRRQQAKDELPLLIDLLRLLQSVGLSMDQSLHVIVNEFRDVMPVLSGELDVAVQAHARGRTREQSLLRLMRDYENEDISAICRLIVQVDQHGGAMQEPLHNFSERLREQRKMDMKEKTGKLTVKMTGVMVLTLLPALLIVTGGAGFLAVIRGLAGMGGG
jgi:tight adherence protein C